MEDDLLLALADEGTEQTEPAPVPPSVVHSLPGQLPTQGCRAPPVKPPPSSDGARSLVARVEVPSSSRKGFADSGQGSFVEKATGIRMKNPLVSSSQLHYRLKDLALLPLSQLRSRHTTIATQGPWALIGILGEKSPSRESHSGRAYSIWKLTDLNDACVSLFLFGAAHHDLWKQSVGSVICCLSPSVKSDSDLSVSVNDSQSIWTLGTAADFGYCKGTTKSGQSCKAPVNVSKCSFCSYHVKAEFKRLQPTHRGEFKGHNLQSAFRAGMASGLHWTPGTFTSLNRESLPGMLPASAATMQGATKLAVRRGSISGSKYLSTVADPQRMAHESKTAAELEARMARARANARVATLPIPPPRARHVVMASRPASAPASKRPRTAPSQPALQQGMVELDEGDVGPVLASRERAIAALREGRSLPHGRGPACVPLFLAQDLARRGAKRKLEAERGIEAGGRVAEAGPHSGSQPAARESSSSRAGSIPGQGSSAAAPGKRTALAAAFGDVLSEVDSLSGAAPVRSQYASAVEAESEARLQATLESLERRDAAAAKMEAMTKLAVTAFHCSVCRYTAERRRPECAAHAHAVRSVRLSKRWWKCRHCAHRFATVGVKLPTRRCPKCNDPGMDFEGASMYAGRREVAPEKSAVASREGLQARGEEIPWIGR